MAFDINHTQSDAAEDNEAHQTSGYRENHPDFVPKSAEHMLPPFLVGPLNLTKPSGAVVVLVLNSLLYSR
jgi:hypothetical protein